MQSKSFVSTSRRISTPSRRRRIIYESAQRLAHEYITDATYKVQLQNEASQLIQNVWKTYKEQSRFYDAVESIHGLYKISIAKQELYHRRSQRRNSASTTISNFLRRSNDSLQTASAIVIQKYWRGAIARVVAQESKLTLLEMECSAIVIQSFIRTYLARAVFERRHYSPSASVIQRKFRSYLGRKQITRRKLMHESCRKLQGWWRNMKVVLYLLRRSAEEKALRLVKMENVRDENMDLLDDSKSLPFIDCDGDFDEGGISFQRDSSGVEQEYELSTSEETIEEEEFTFTLSSVESSEDHGSDGLDKNVNDDNSKSTVESVVAKSSQDQVDEEMQRELELIFKRNQSATLLQNKIRSFILKQQRERQTQKAKEKLAANILTNQLWKLYKQFIARQERRRNAMKNKAATMIQTHIRSYLAIRIVEELRESMYEETLDRFFTEFHMDSVFGRKNKGSSNAKQWPPKVPIPPFMENSLDEDSYDTSKSTTSATNKENDASWKPNTPLFHDEWVGLLPESTRNCIPKGCNLYGVDLDDENSLIRCLKFHYSPQQSEQKQQQ